MRKLMPAAAALALVSACTTGTYQPVGQPATTQQGSQPSVPASGAPADPAQPRVVQPGPIIRADPNAPQGGAIARLPEPPQPSPAAGAAAALLAQSRDERDSGEFDRAAATLERALALAPDDPALWVELAEVQLEQGEPALAQETARKALTLTGNEPSLEARARRLISR